MSELFNVQSAILNSVEELLIVEMEVDWGLNASMRYPVSRIKNKGVKNESISCEKHIRGQ